MKLACSHGSTALSVMIAVFTCIDFVNDAMAFYDHPYTKALLIINVLLLCLNSFFLLKLKALSPYCFGSGIALAFFMLLGICQSFIDSAPMLFTTFTGHVLTLVFCLVSLVFSVILSYRLCEK